ncbi:MAG: DUF2175 domain-containing protein [Sedimenticola sp.]|nr:MAG: DUF2175 domain-containing protein [Sedimenticola sp.]
MRCEFCNQVVHGIDGITLPGKGVAHRTCFEIDRSTRRIFNTLDLSQLELPQLVDLKDLVLAEINDRERKHSGTAEIELF